MGRSRLRVALLAGLVLLLAWGTAAAGGEAEAEDEGEAGCGCGGLSRDAAGGALGEAGAGAGGAGGCHAGEPPEATVPPEDLEMVVIPGGTYTMGERNRSITFPADKEWPTREVTVAPFRLDRAEITNRAFGEFVRATSYTTDAEKFGWSFVFEPFLPEELNESVTQAVQGAEWWLPVEGASWAHPEGPPTDVANRGDVPAVHLSWNDVAAYCAWRGKRLPTEKEWERAARGGLHQKRYPWGDDATELRHLANTFEGEFPHAPADPPHDGYLGPAPAGTFPPSQYGLYHIVGNVWEFTSDTLLDEEGRESHWQRGGSFMCHVSYCYRYRTSARISNTADTSAGNTGGRCAADLDDSGAPVRDEL